MTHPSPVSVARTFFDALGRGDFPTVMAQFSDTVVWHQPGDNRFSGVHHGVQAVGSLLGSMTVASEETFRLSVTGSPMVNGELVAVPVRFTGSRSDASMDMAGVDLLTVRDGKIVEVHLFSEDAAAEDVFWNGGDALHRDDSAPA